MCESVERANMIRFGSIYVIIMINTFFQTSLETTLLCNVNVITSHITLYFLQLGSQLRSLN